MKTNNINTISRSSRGFTLIELMVVLAISAILLFIGVPSFQNMSENNRLSSAINEIHGNLTFARNQAINQISYVTVCPLDQNNECSTNWINGMDIFIDEDKDGVFDDDDGETLLKKATPFNANDTLTFHNIKSITFTPDGLINGSADEFLYCTTNNKKGVSITYSGLAKIIDTNTCEKL
jgi:prepilin-type N-terminal cleavage/methylation domain-containing protein